MCIVACEKFPFELLMLLALDFILLFNYVFRNMLNHEASHEAIKSTLMSCTCANSSQTNVHQEFRKQTSNLTFDVEVRNGFNYVGMLVCYNYIIFLDILTRSA